jgi:hypothetical protein
MLIYSFDQTFEDIANALQESLTSLGVSCERTTTISVSNPSLYLLLGANNPLPSLPKHFIIYQLEQRGSAWFTDSYIEKLRNAQMVWEYSLVNYRYLTRDLGLTNVHYVPLGYSPCMDSTGPTIPRDIDVLFFGSMNARRQEIIQRFSAVGTKVHVECNVWGEERNKLIDRSRIVLNLHYYPEAILETSRLTLLLSRGACVVSEKSADLVLDREYSQYCYICDDVVRTCQELLANQISVCDMIRKFNQTESKPKDGWGFPSENFKQNRTMISVIPIVKLKEVISTLMDSPSFDIQAFFPAECEEGGAVLKLPTDANTTFVKVSLVTPTKNRSHLFKIALWNFNHFDYPRELLEWVIIDDSDQPDESAKLQQLLPLADPRIKYIKLPASIPLWQKRNMCVREATGEVIVHLDDDDYYFPSSILAKVKLLQKYKSQGYQCVGTRELAVYHLKNNYSFIMTSQLMGEATMAYYRTFWEARPFDDVNLKFGEGAHFLAGRTDKVVDFPYWFNMIALSHGNNYTGNLRELEKPETKTDSTVTNFFSLWDLETQLFFLGLKKKL